MSDVMLLGVLRMPMPENPDPMTLRQFVSRAQQAACRIEADADELEELRAKCETLRKDAERYHKLRALVRGERHLGTGRNQGFAFPSRYELQPLADIMRGSVSQHLDAAIDALPAVGAA